MGGGAVEVDAGGIGVKVFAGLGVVDPLFPVPVPVVVVPVVGGDGAVVF